MSGRNLLAGALCCVLPILGLGQASQSPIPLRFPHEQISVEQWQSYLDEVKAVPDVTCAEMALHQYKCDSSAQRTIWIFTLEGHPAHPAVSRGVMVIANTAAGTTLGIDRSGHFAGDYPAFIAWMHEFDALDKRQMAAWQKFLTK